MHIILGRIFRYILRFSLAFILLFLFIGLAKQNWDFPGYIQSLNQRSRSDAWQQGGISGIFWGTSSGENEIELSTGDASSSVLSGQDGILTGDSSMSGVDVYDPNFEQDLNQMPVDTLSSGDYKDTSTDYGFVKDKSATGESMTGTVTTPSTINSGNSKSQQLLELMKQREMDKTGN